MKMSTLFWLGILFVIEIKGAHATWAPGKEPDHLQEGDPRITQIVEHPGGVKKFWYEYWIQKKDGTTAKKTGVQIFGGDGKLTDDIRDFNTDNTVTKIDHTTGEEVRVSTIVPSLRKFFQPSPKEVEEMRLFRRFTKYSIIDGYEAFKKNVKINAKDPCPAEMKEELRKACLTFGANPNSFELSREPDPSINPKEKCLPGVAAFPDDPFYKAACIGTWLGLQGNRCGTSGLEGSSGRLAFLVCSATIAAREEHECKEVLPAAEKSMDGSLHIRPTQQEEAKQAIVMTASEGRHLFLGVCGGLKKIYAEAKLVHCSKDSAVATNHMKDMHRTAGKIQQELTGKENKKNLANPSSVPNRK